MTACMRPFARRLAVVALTSCLGGCGIRVESGGARNDSRGVTGRASAPSNAVRGVPAIAPSCPEPDGGGAAGDPQAPLRFAAIGDYGVAGEAVQRVSQLIRSWQPELVITLGDNNYPVGATDTIDQNIGQYFHDLIGPYYGRFGCGSRRNRFFPALGNHDWYTPGAAPYLSYFTLPHNERYYDVVWRDVHLFAIDSDPNEPHGITATSAQALWLKSRLESSTAAWQIVYMHHPPYSSGPHGPSIDLRWPYAAWGADLVLAGHDHTYERLQVDGITYIVNGLGGASLYALGARLPESVIGYDASFGALQIEADASQLVTRFFNVDGVMIDEAVIARR
jgi:hypothetical protein